MGWVESGRNFTKDVLAIHLSHIPNRFIFLLTTLQFYLSVRIYLKEKKRRRLELERFKKIVSFLCRIVSNTYVKFKNYRNENVSE